MTLLLAAASISGLVPLLVWLLVLALVIYVVFLVVGMIPIPEPAKKIVTVVIGLIFLLLLLDRLGFGL